MAKRHPFKAIWSKGEREMELPLTLGCCLDILAVLLAMKVVVVEGREVSAKFFSLRGHVLARVNLSLVLKWVRFNFGLVR